RFEFKLMAGRFEFVLRTRFVLPLFEFLFALAARLAFPFRFSALPLAFSLSFAFLLEFLGRLGLFSFAEVASLVFVGFSSGDFSGAATSEVSPSFAGRLTSMATVWPTFTTSPPLGS